LREEKDNIIILIIISLGKRLVPLCLLVKRKERRKRILIVWVVAEIEGEFLLRDCF